MEALLDATSIGYRILALASLILYVSAMIKCIAAIVYYEKTSFAIIYFGNAIVKYSMFAHFTYST
jgi:hypothetical protein